MTEKNEVLIAEVKVLRVKCDELIQNAAHMRTSGELTLAWRSLQLAKCWMGRLLAEFGEKSPYQTPAEPSEIQPNSDVFEGELTVGFGNSASWLESINWMRDGIATLFTKIKSFEFGFRRDIIRITEHIKFHLTEARFWYGLELQNIRFAETLK